MERDFLLERFRLHQEATIKRHQPMERLVAEFSALLPLTEADLWADGPVSAPPAAVEEPRPVRPEPVQSPVADESVAAPVAATPAPAPVQNAPQPVDTPATTFVPTPAFVPTPVPAPAVPAPAYRATTTEAAPVRLYEKLKAERPAAVTLSRIIAARKIGRVAGRKSPPGRIVARSHFHQPAL